MNASLNYSCSFFGHRELKITKEEVDKLKNEIIRLIEENNCKTFYFGGFGEFDDLCYDIVCELKQTYPDIKRVFCLSDARLLDKTKQPKWLREQSYEQIVYFDLDFSYWYTRIYYRNCEIIKRSDYVIFYVDESKGEGGAYKALKFAKKIKSNYKNVAK